MAKKKTPDVRELIEIYRSWPQERLDEEIDALFDLCFAILETVESDSIESFPNPDIKIKISCEVLKKDGKFYN
jgi:hypothetical protein